MQRGGRVGQWCYCLSCSFLSQPHEKSSHLLLTAAEPPARACLWEEKGDFYPLFRWKIAAVNLFYTEYTDRGVCLMLRYEEGPGLCNTALWGLVWVCDAGGEGKLCAVA